MRFFILLLFYFTLAICSAQEGIFASEDVLEFQISGEVKALFNDRGDDSDYHPITIQIEGEEISLKAKTRGNFRRKKGNCTYPPILLNFKKSDKATQASIFNGQDEIKLVTPCKKDSYVLREYMVYKIYERIASYSFKARLVKVVYSDNEKGVLTKPLYGILLEDQDQMADRYGGKIDKTDRLRPERTEMKSFHEMAVFQFFIGNTDWSTQYRHNIKLLKFDSINAPLTVPYDFDHAGIVSAPYAKPASELQLTSVQTRRYRGFCESSLTAFEPIIEKFRQQKEVIFSMYSENPKLSKSYKKSVVRYMEKFYDYLDNPRKLERAFRYPCDPNGTGNVVIRGLGR